MPTYLTFIRMGRLRVIGGVAIGDVKAIGNPKLRMIPLPSADYNVFAAITGGRPQPFIARLQITTAPTSLTLAHYEEGMDFEMRTNFLAVGSYPSMITVDREIIPEAHRRMNRSYLRMAMLMVDDPSERIEWDLGRIAVCETGYGAGAAHLYYQKDGLVISFIKGLGNGVSHLERL